MSDELPSYADIEKYVHDLPKSIIDKMPDCIASRRAKQLLPTIYDYVKEAREQAREDRTTALSVEAAREAREAGVVP